MSVLSRDTLLKRIINIKDDFCITPILDWKKQISESSIDLRLDNQFIIITRTSLASVNPIDSKNFSNNLNQFQKLVKVPYGEKFILHPNELVIGSTLEYLSFPKDLMAFVIGRSSWGRLGLIIATATVINPCFKGNLTLELVNSGNVPIELYPGVRIAQLTFHKIEKPSECRQSTGKYHLQIGPGFSKIHDDPELKYLSFPKYRIAIGITGHKGSGKSILINYLTEDKLYKYFSLSHVVRKKFIERFSEQEITREKLQDFGDDLRKKSNTNYCIAKLITNNIRESILDHTDSIVISGIRNPGEIDFLRRLPNFHLIGIQATKNKIKKNLQDSGYIPKKMSNKEFDKSFKRDCGNHDDGDYGQNIKECINKVSKQNLIKYKSDYDDLLDQFKSVLMNLE